MKYFLIIVNKKFLCCQWLNLDHTLCKDKSLPKFSQTLNLVKHWSHFDPYSSFLRLYCGILKTFYYASTYNFNMFQILSHNLMLRNFSRQRNKSSLSSLVFVSIIDLAMSPFCGVWWSSLKVIKFRKKYYRIEIKM